MISTNRLAKEKSPYLLQHAQNPVDWYPWGEEAFEKAKREDKPIFLSIGYSTCHWCHVMAHESFEDEEIAGLMNDAFVSIKVDREERPDIDGVYMTVCQMLTGSGGWPLTIIMTPGKKPFFAGTYFPKDNRFGRPGMKDIVKRIKELWQNKRGELLKSAGEISEAIKTASLSQHGDEYDESILDKAFEHLKRRYNPVSGGFGNAPKFPTPHNLLFLLRYWKRKKEPDALEMVEKTLIKMRNGGIFDQIGFGFHRYSTDKKWLVPHFEKMLYDQALLTGAYTETFLVTKNPIYEQTTREILEYVIREMTSPEGAFYSAEDADSEGEEGKFYLWSTEEIRDVLNSDEAELAIRIFNMEDNGNWVDQMHEGYSGTNILHIHKTLKELSVEFNISENELNKKVETIRSKLFKVREKRIYPFKDDKILTDWNGLMISAFCKAAQAFDENTYIEAAEKAMGFILSKLNENNGSLLHRFREGDASIPANLDDYSFIISALLDLYETVFDTSYLEKAIQLNEYTINHFFDEENGGFYFTSYSSEELLVRHKEIYDGAVPSGNSVSILNLLRLNRITGNQNYEILASKTADAFSKSIITSPSAFTQALCALDLVFGPSYEIVIAGDTESFGTKEMLKIIRKNYLPNKVVLLKEPGNEKIGKISPFTLEQDQVNNKTAAYVCQNFSCNFPVTEIDELKKLLNLSS